MSHTTTQSAEVSRRTFTDQVSDAILDLIRDRGLEDGDMLPPTAELAERFGVSRPVIREALAELAGRGMIARRQGRESVVRLPGAEEIARLLDHQVKQTKISDVQLHELREALELRSARLAATRADEADLDELRRWLTALKDAERDIEASLEADVELHRAVVVASGNPAFALVADSVAPLLLSSRRHAWQSYRARGGAYDELIARHERIVEAVESGDPDAAEAAMGVDLDDARAHLENGRPRRKSKGGRKAGR